MPWIEPGLFDSLEMVAVPYAPQSETSEAGARHAKLKAGSQCAALLALYEARGPLTDHEVEAALEWPLARVCARRNALVQHKLVKKADVICGPCGVGNQRWRRV